MLTSQLKLEVVDLETYFRLFLYCGYNPTTGEKFEYEISFRKNQLDALVKHLLEYKRDYAVTFNGIGFDNQVLQFIIDSHDKWIHYGYIQIIEAIYNFAQEIIDNQNYELPPVYKEQYMDIKQIDLFKIFHYDNQSRRCSLKWAFEFSLDGDIEELPIDHRKDYLNSEEIDSVIEYCWNDVMATCNGYKCAIGDTEHQDYKDKNKIQLRLDLIEEFNLPQTAINWNDVKIGAELNKKNYLELSGITPNKLWDKIKNRKTKTGFCFKDCFPIYMKFETKEFQDFFNKIGKTKVNLNEKQEFPFTYKGVNYMFAKGGGHTSESARKIVPEKDYLILDADVGSMYPNIIRKRNIYPSHLGPKWNEAYVSNIPRRLEAKKKYKETKEEKYNNFQECFKLVLNGCFGRLIDRHDWQYDPFAGMNVTIGGQVDIFMLAEDLAQIPTLSILSMNTDGLTVTLHKDYINQYHQTCLEWEKQVGNDILGNLEYVEYEILVQTSVNDYIALKKADWKVIDGEFKGVSIDKPIDHKDRVKKKGDFLTSYELHKNKSKSIIPITLEKYFIQQLSVEEIIKNHRNIFDFMIAKKSSKDYFYRIVDRKTGEQTDLNKLVRYYCATNKNITEEKRLPEISDAKKIAILKKSGWEEYYNDTWIKIQWTKEGIDYTKAALPLKEAYEYLLKEIKNSLVILGKLYKIKHENSDKSGPEKSNCESESDLQILYNKPFTCDNWEDYQIDYQYYINQTYKIIDKIYPEKARDRKEKQAGILSLF